MRVWFGRGFKSSWFVPLDDSSGGSSSGTYGQYVTAYTTTSPVGGDPEVHYNPAYDDGHSTTGYGERGSGTPKRFLMIFTPTVPGEDTGEC